MPLSVAEKQRRYRERIKQDPERYNEYLSKEKKRWEDRKKTGKIKLISDMTKREKRHKRLHGKINRQSVDKERRV